MIDITLEINMQLDQLGLLRPSLQCLAPNAPLNGISVQPRDIWSHELGDINKSMSAQLQGYPAASAITYGFDLSRDRMMVGITVAGKTKGVKRTLRAEDK